MFSDTLNLLNILSPQTMIVNIYSVRKYRVGKQKKEKPIGFSLLSVCLTDVSHKKGRRIGSFASHFNQVVTFYQNRAKPC